MDDDMKDPMCTEHFIELCNNWEYWAYGLDKTIMEQP
jgi:hypothetical protein